MKNFKIAFTKALCLNAIFLLLLSVYRLFFTYYGKDVDLSDLGFDILMAFCMGCRFDLSVIASVNAPLVVLFVLLFIIGKQSLLKPFFCIFKILLHGFYRCCFSTLLLCRFLFLRIFSRSS